jgi:hypothetical protein
MRVHVAKNVFQKDYPDVPKEKAACFFLTKSQGNYMHNFNSDIRIEKNEFFSKK